MKRIKHNTLILPKIEYNSTIKHILSLAAENWRNYSRNKTDTNYKTYVASVQELSNETGLSLMQCMQLIINRSTSKK